MAVPVTHDQDEALDFTAAAPYGLGLLIGVIPALLLARATLKS